MMHGKVVDDCLQVVQVLIVFGAACCNGDLPLAVGKNARNVFVLQTQNLLLDRVLPLMFLVLIPVRKFLSTVFDSANHDNPGPMFSKLSFAAADFENAITPVDPDATTGAVFFCEAAFPRNLNPSSSVAQ